MSGGVCWSDSPAILGRRAVITRIDCRLQSELNRPTAILYTIIIQYLLYDNGTVLYDNGVCNLGFVVIELELSYEPLSLLRRYTLESEDSPTRTWRRMHWNLGRCMGRASN